MSALRSEPAASPSRETVTGDGRVTCTVTDGVARVTLSRPDKLNSLTLDTLDSLVATARTLGADRDLRAVVLTGEGRSFCAGLDFATVGREPRRIAAAFLPRPWSGTNVFQEACWAWRRLPVPVVAAVHGHCLGGGVQIALGADFRITTPDAQWSVLEAKWGLIPDMSGVRALADQVGMDVAKRLTMTAETISGTEAARLGLATEVADDPVAAAEELVATLRTRSPDQLAAAKRLFERTWTSSPRATFARERLEQLWLFTRANTKVARKAATARTEPSYRPRGTR
ncbi:crotonase/enoyl-CoA hydratase family protein [Nocardioides sp. CFH 31398]|uniref:crotonase/enoyl-CoA hydratase family protein n=1 Tax=Nocardioides sp. CFH 31398 TaxID=2919579 RepID=UPI001F0664E3|nr:crotonase/enoyl-CoA hydratase family protein [Nocardioides sp. CFH 31398]MCH1864943.1 crotonase/enoyl-CoA hydratase family protein [Nocardioides sp. CFH 31398]